MANNNILKKKASAMVLEPFKNYMSFRKDSIDINDHQHDETTDKILTTNGNILPEPAH